MDHLKDARGPASQGLEMERDVVLPRRVPVVEELDMDAEQAPTHQSQSIWGHRLRQNIRGRLHRRGVDLDLIDGPVSLSIQAQMLPTDGNLPAYDDMNGVLGADVSPSWKEDVQVWPRMLLQTIESHKPGICKLCNRTMTNITKHHLHPKIGRKSERRPPPGMINCSKEYLNTTIDLCRPCHSMVHHIVPNELMSDSYYSLLLLESHPRVQAWVSWVRRQRIPSPRPFRQPAPGRILRSAKHAKAKRINLKQKKSTLNLRKTQDALAKLWIDNASDIPRSLVDLPALQEKLSDMVNGDWKIRIRNIRKAMACNPEYQGWYRSIFPSPADTEFANRRITRSIVMSARKPLKSKDGTSRLINDALDTIWRENGNSFPKFPVEKGSRGKALREAVRVCMRKAVDACASTKFYAEQLQQGMQMYDKYRSWYEWTYPDMIWQKVDQKIDQFDAADENDHNDINGEMGGVADPGGHGLKFDGLSAHKCYRGTGSQIDPIVFDLTDEEDEAVIENGQGHVNASQSGRVVIDLTTEDDD